VDERAVFVPRRDTDSRVVTLLGGRAFPGVFDCAACGATLTDPVMELMTGSLPDVSGSSRMEHVGEPYVPEGGYTVVTTDDPPGWMATGRFLLNDADVPGIRPHDDPTRTNGCCGLDGLGGPNVCCEQGHEVGTERSDCWTLHYVALDPDRVRERRP